MTREEKEKVIKLKKCGLSVKKISNELSISINTVKSYLQRNKEKFENKKVDGNHCLFCGSVLHHIMHKKHKKFCSDKCRYDYWNERKCKVL